MTELIIKLLMWGIDILIKDSKDRAKAKRDLMKITAKYHADILDSVRLRKEWEEITSFVNAQSRAHAIKEKPMLSSFKSAFLLMALEYICAKGLEFAKNYTEERKADVEKFVKDMLPGEDFDALGWALVESLLPKLFDIAAELIDKIDGEASPHVRHGLMLQAIANASA
jgi:hypothetical protein